MFLNAFNKEQEILKLNQLQIQLKCYKIIKINPKTSAKVINKYITNINKILNDKFQLINNSNRCF